MLAANWFRSLASRIPGYGDWCSSVSESWVGYERTDYLEASWLLSFVIDRYKSGEYGIVQIVFDLIEEAMSGGDMVLATIVATCFVESLSNRAVNKPELRRIAVFLGPESLRHYDSWERRHTVES